MNQRLLILHHLFLSEIMSMKPVSNLIPAMAMEKQPTITLKYWLKLSVLYNHFLLDDNSKMYFELKNTLD